MSPTQEWGYAMDEFNQSIYFERWQRLMGDGGSYLEGEGGRYLAMRRLPPAPSIEVGE